MASGSFLQILKRYIDDRAQKFDSIQSLKKHCIDLKIKSISPRTDENTRRDILESFKNNFNDVITTNYIFYPYDKNLYVDKSLNIWEEIACVDFNSEFTSLYEYYDLNSSKLQYSKKIISDIDCDNIIRAINYIISYHGKYDKEIEKIINTEYIKVFGDYIYSYYCDTKLTKYEYEAEEINLDNLDNFRTICKTYRLLSEDTYLKDAEYKLVYTKW